MSIYFERFFNKKQLKAGYELFQNGTVRLGYEDEEVSQSVVLNSKSVFNGADIEADVDIEFFESKNPIMDSYCDCRAADYPCKHIAATFYQIMVEGRYDRGLVAEQYKVTRPERERLLPEKYESEQFYDLRDALDRYQDVISQPEIKAAKRLFENGDARLTKIALGKGKYYYPSDIEGQVCYGFAEIKDKRGVILVNIAIDRDSILEYHCERTTCHCNYYRSFYGAVNDHMCEHAAAAFLLLDEYIQNNELGDLTDNGGLEALSIFRQVYSRKNQQELADTSLSQRITLEPKVILENQQLKLSFKVGADKLYVAKNLKSLVSTYNEKGVLELGKNNALNFEIDSMTEKGQKWMKFLNIEVNQELEHKAHMEAGSKNYWYRETVKSENMTSFLQLYGRRLDEAYKLLAEEGQILFQNKDRSEKEKRVSVREASPNIQLAIAPLKNGKKVAGIRVNGTMDSIISGIEYKYFVDEKGLARVLDEGDEVLSLLESIAHDGDINFSLGKNNVAEFYYRMLPLLQKRAEVTDNAAELVEELLPDECVIKFYLDAEEGYLTCRIEADYDKVKVNVLDRLHNDVKHEAFRDKLREQEAAEIAFEYFTQVADGAEMLRTESDEDTVYRVLESGIPALSKVGEIHCTDAFQSQNKRKKFKISVGVSVQSDIMNLEISSDDISPKELLDILDSYKKKKKYHRLKSGEFVDINEDSLRELSEMMEAMHISAKEFTKGKMKLPLYRALYLDKMLENSSEIEENRDKHFKALVKGFKTVQDSDFEIPKAHKKILRKYQEFGYKWMRTISDNHFGGILADDMGLGKTLQVISVLLAHFSENKKSETALVVCPASLVYNWVAEFEKFAPSLKVAAVTGTVAERAEIIKAYTKQQVLVTSYDLLKRDIAEYEGTEFSYEIIDEAQYIKTHTTAAAKSVKVITAKYKLALTGTPIENRLSELWSIFDYLMPGFLYGYDTFKKELETPIVKYKDEEATRKLKRMVSPFILRRLKQDVLTDLPDKLEEVQYARFGSEQQTLYDAQVAHMKEMLQTQSDEEFGSNRVKILAEITRIRQICCDPSLYVEKYKGESAKRNACLDLVQSAIEGGHKMLLFSQFTTMLDLLAEDLKKAGIEYYMITGATSKEKRIQLVNSFNENEVPVFLISLKAGGTGLNLTGADVVIHYDPWWNIAAQNQATDRAHRIGQTKVVNVYKLIAKGTIEEKIVKMQQDKADLANEILSGETGSLVNMSREDLLELFE